jgi:hypothetical protein
MKHYYGSEDRCMKCDCRPWGKWAALPCGAADSAPFIPADPENELAQFWQQWHMWAVGQDLGR